MKAILRSINNFSCKLKQSNNQKYNISPKISNHKLKSANGDGNVVIDDAIVKNLKDYKIYGNTIQSKLPNGYTQVDYIESGGTQYIDTLFNPTPNTKIVVDFQFTDSTIAQQRVFENIHEETDGLCVAMYISGSNPKTFAFACRNNSANWTSTGMVADTDRHLFTMDIPNGKIIIDNSNITMSSTAHSNSSNYSILILAYRQASGSLATTKSKGKLYLTKIYENDVLVRDFIPCYRNSDNEVGLYDLVNNVFYTNQGTGVFTYGSVAPTPDAPIDMVSCGDRTKNLLPLSIIPTQTVSGLSITNDNGEIYITGPTTTIDIPVNITLRAGTYTNKNFNNTGFESNISLRDNNGTVIQTGTYVNLNSTTEKTFTLSEDKKISILRLYFKGGNTLTNYHLQAQLEIGETATSYESYYDGYKIPVNVRSENLFDINTITPNTYITNAGATGPSRSTHLVDYIPVYKDKPIIVSYDYDTLVTTTNRSLVFYDTNKNYISGQYYSPIPKKHQFIPEQDGYIRFAYDKNCTNIYISYYNETTNIYLDEPLRKSDDGTYVDHIDFQNKKVYRQIKEITLNGTEAWSRVSAKNNHYRFRVTYSDLAAGADRVLYCTHFKNNGDAYSFEGISGSTSNVLYIRWDELFETVDDLKTWLSSNTPIVDYVLATPTEEDIELPDINLIDGKNIITIGTEVQGVFEAEYYSKEIIDISDYKYNLRKVED